MLRGDLGTSFVSGKPVLGEILRRLPVNLELATIAITMALCLGIPIGTLSAVRRDTWTDAGIRFGSVLGYSVPNFWVATLTVLAGSLLWPGMPILQYVPFTESPGRNLTLVLIPSFVLSLTVLPLIVRMTRASVLENLRLDYVRTARSKGLPERRVVYRHVLANSLIAVLNVTGVQIGVLIGGLVLTEEIFILPGIGRLLLESIQKRDFPVITGATLFLATVFVTMNLVVDLLHAVLDPRVRR
jgi:peptide/nickel transport system permease protein